MSLFKLLDAVNTPEANTAGLLTTCLAAFNTFFQMFNPVLTGLFYIASIAWLCVQMYYRIKDKKRKNEK
jgi:hypothetical protein